VRIALGTVQFGLNYGIANQRGQLALAEAESVLECARQHGVDTVDTAIAYGESESVLGAIGVSDFKIVTKLPSMPKDCRDVAGWMYDQCLGSLGRMQVDSVDGLLLHRSQELVGPLGSALNKALQGLKTDGLVKKVGVSIYSPSELDLLMPLCDIDLIQAPFNLIDRRMATSGWLSKLHAAGIEVHTRSTFLQGLLLMREDNIPSGFSRWNHLWRVWHDWLEMSSTPAVTACLAFVQRFPEIDKVIFGVDSIQQFEQIIDAAALSASLDLPDLDCEDEQLVNPSKWGGV
jgi:aryl-alcohol dehydrogenase-like predicted oxidoreductase